LPKRRKDDVLLIVGSPWLPKFTTSDEALTTVCEIQEFPKAEADVQIGRVFMVPAEEVVTVPAFVEVTNLLPWESNTLPAWTYPLAVRFVLDTEASELCPEIFNDPPCK
jgi:hypothetical protein